jgi:hypothetical protein
MPSSGMLRRVALVITDVSEKLTRATQRNIPEDSILLLYDIVVNVHVHTCFGCGVYLWCVGFSVLCALYRVK